MARRLVVRSATSDREREELISFRTNLYVDAGKHAGVVLMRDAWDNSAIQIGVWDGNLPVAAARVICVPATEEYEHDRFLEWPEEFPPRSECAEISRFCINRSHRDWGTIQALCRGIAESVIATERRYFVACCTAELKYFYATFFGAKFTGHVIEHADLGPKAHHMFWCDYQNGMVGRGLALVPWLSLWPAVALRELVSGRLLSWQSRTMRASMAAKCMLGLCGASAAELVVSAARRRRRLARVHTTDPRPRRITEMGK